MKKDYVLTIGIDKFYLNEQEVNFYLESVDKGAKYVSIPTVGLLGTSFQSLVHKNILEGKWLCESDKWHGKGSECFCGQEYKQLENGTMQVIKKG